MARHDPHHIVGLEGNSYTQLNLTELNPILTVNYEP